MIKKITLSLIAVFGVFAISMAQNKQVTGIVNDESGQPIVGATVIVESTGVGTTTGIDGMFSISTPSTGSLLVSYIGYETSIMSIAGKNNIEVELKTGAEAIENVIVTAFGTATKEAFTGSATVVASDEIAKTQVSNVVQSIAGRVAGVQLANESGQPDSAPKIRIRGFSSINAGNEPLYIVDGMPYSGNIGLLNPGDVASMTVLKDAASNALYGARGANGVIIITTKKANTRDAIVSVDAKWGVNSHAMQNYDYISNTAEYYETYYNSLNNYYINSVGQTSGEAHRTVNNLMITDKNQGLGYQIYNVPQDEYFIGANGKMNPNATLGRIVKSGDNEYLLQPDNWFDEAYRTSLRQEYNVSISGMTDRSSVYMSFGYLDNKGITENSDYKRITARLKADYQAKKWLKFGGNASYANYDSNSLDDKLGANSSGNVFAFTSGIAPIYPVYIRDAAGNVMKNAQGITMFDYGDSTNAGMSRPQFSGTNAISDSRLNTDNSNGNSFIGNAFTDISFFKDLKLTISAGVELDEWRKTSINNPYFGQFVSDKGIVEKVHERRYGVNMQQVLNYTKSFGYHNFNVMVGHEYYNYKQSLLGAAKNNMFSQDNEELDGAILDRSQARSNTKEYNNEGYFGRVMYDYESKYFASASYRRDASSRFHPDNRWGNFWSVGGAWIISKENFMSDTSNWLDVLKFKASIGSQGNDNIGDFRYTDTFLMQNANGLLGLVFDQKGNPDITWETNTNFNTGFEFSFLKGRIAGGIEYFSRTTSDMLFSFPVPPSIGYSSYYTNVGDLANNGVEFELYLTPVQTKNVQWDINFNLSHVKSVIKYLPEERKTVTVEGHEGYVSNNRFYGEGVELYTFYIPNYAGVNDEGRSTWYMDEKDANGALTGNRVTTADYAKATDYLSGSATPDLYGGFGTSVSFYGFDLSVNLNFQIGGVTYDYGYASSMSSANRGGNWHSDILNAWTPENSDSDIPRLQFNDSYSVGTSDRFLTDASYLNLQNINFGYTLPNRVTKKFGVENLRLYLSCENVAYISKRKGFDPRYSFIGDSDQARYSPIRTISGGVTLKF